MSKTRIISRGMFALDFKNTFNLLLRQTHYCKVFTLLEISEFNVNAKNWSSFQRKHCYLLIFLISKTIVFHIYNGKGFQHLTSLKTKRVNIVLYWPIWLELVISVSQPVQKTCWFVPAKISVYTGKYQLYWWLLAILARKYESASRKI